MVPAMATLEESSAVGLFRCTLDIINRQVLSRKLMIKSMKMLLGLRVGSFRYQKGHISGRKRLAFSMEEVHRSHSKSMANGLALGALFLDV